MIKNRVWASWIECATPHFNRGGRFLSFESIVNNTLGDYEKVTLDQLETTMRSTLYEALLHLERGDTLTIQMEIEREEK